MATQPDLARDWEARLSPHAARSTQARRRVPEEPCPWRTPFQRDRDRIIHCKAFRRLAHKTQAFISTAGDHFRTRLTHTLEVSQIARTIARALALNEDLAEAAAMGHDLGHAPFGHAGERTLDELHPGGFQHQLQSLRVVDVLANDGLGLNLTEPVRECIVKHSKGQGPVFAPPPRGPAFLEGQAVRAADLIAYLSSDLADALEAGLLQPSDVPPSLVEKFSSAPSPAIGAMTTDLLENSRLDKPQGPLLAFSPTMAAAMEEFRAFLHRRVYRCPRLYADMVEGQKLVARLYAALMENDELFGALPLRHLAQTRSQAVCDFIAGMTDSFAVQFAAKLP
jgi:dGTPase